MKLSWSHKLFFAINKNVGRYRALDIVMIVIAHALIYILLFILLVWFVIVSVGNNLLQNQFVIVSASSFLLAYATDYLIAVLSPHRRPVKEFPNIKILLQTLGTWKSFPSDHMIVATLTATLAFLFGAPVWLWTLLGTGAVATGLSRIYVGVHYPRDIVGGLILGVFSATIIYSIVII